MSSSVRYNFSNRAVVLTGASGGFGRAVARQFLGCDAHVALWDADAGTLEHFLMDLQPEFGARAIAQTVDVTDELSVEVAARDVVTQFGKIDTLINNAGILGPVASSWEHSVAEFRRVVDVNLTGCFICSRALVPVMLENPRSSLRGRIVNVGSIQGKEGMPMAAAYAASKAGIISLTKTLGKELAQTGILVNAITPAAVMTAMSHALTPERKREILEKIPMGRFLTSEEVALQIAWLCSEDCSFATGAVFDLSGGRATY